MGLIFNPITGEFNITGVSGGLGSYTPSNPLHWDPPPTNIESALNQLAARTHDANYKIEKFTLMAADITNKQITLAQAPISPTKTRLIITNGGIEQDYGTDFVVSGAVLSWNGLGFETLAEIGEKIIIIYSSN